MMEVFQITSPQYTVDGVLRVVDARRYLTLADFQREIDKRERMGYTKCYILAIYTQTDPVYPAPNHTLYWVRSFFTKPENLDGNK